MSLTEEFVPRVLPVRTTPQGWSVARVHHSLIPDYDFEAASEGLTDEQIRQELEIDWLASQHKRVYPRFSEIHIARDPLPFNPRKPLVCGWDPGQVPAWAPMQLADTGQLFLYPPIIGPNDEVTGIWEFGQTVADHLLRVYARPYGLTLKTLQLEHYGDPWGNSKPPRSKARSDDGMELRSAYEILRNGTKVQTGFDRRDRPIYEEKKGWGWKIESGAVSITERLEAVRDRLTLLINGRPALMVDPEATAIIEGFMGAYCYRQRADGTYEHDPDKNWWSHVQDAIQYCATCLFASSNADEDEDDEREDQGFQSHASRGRR